MNPDALRRTSSVPHGSSDDFDLLDFSANVNPLMPAGVRQIYGDALDRARRYPPEPPVDFREAAAAALGCDPASVVPTPGGLAAIRLAIESLVTSGDSVLVPAPSFAEYAREVRLQGARPRFVPHTDLVDVDPAGHTLAIACHPNNPTGDAYDDVVLRAFADRCADAGTFLMCDEAFLGFTDRPSLAGHEAVIVIRSLTKLFGLPGLRVGYAVAPTGLADQLRTGRQPWNVSVPALAVGAYCLRQDDFVAETRVRTTHERERLRSRLDEWFDVAPSDAPFLLLDVGDRDVDEIIATAREHGVVVRDATTFRGLDSHVRVAVRLPDENDQLVEALDG